MSGGISVLTTDGLHFTILHGLAAASEEEFYGITVMHLKQQVMALAPGSMFADFWSSKDPEAADQVHLSVAGGPRLDDRYDRFAVLLNERGLDRTRPISPAQFTLVASRRHVISWNATLRYEAPPAMVDILRATAHLRPRDSIMLPTGSRVSFGSAETFNEGLHHDALRAELQSQLTELVSSLMESSRTDPALLAEIETETVQRRPPSAPRAPLYVAPHHDMQVDAESLSLLTNLGYSEGAARRALLLNHMSPMLATDWLVLALENASNDAPLTADEEAAVRLQRQGATVVPDMELVDRLVEMGFNRFDAMAALRASGNHMTTACSWLFGARDPPVPGTRAAQEGRGALAATTLELSAVLEPDGDYMRRLIANPNIARALTDPHIVEQLRSLAADPTLLSTLMQDDEFMQVLLRINEHIDDIEGQTRADSALRENALDGNGVRQ